MAFLPQFQQLDIRPVLQSYQLGSEEGRQESQRGLLRRVGQTASTQGLGAAGAEALAGGDVATGLKLQEMSLDRQLKMYDFLGRAAVQADTPEKWQQYIAILAKNFGQDSVRGFEDFRARESAIILSKSAFDAAMQKKASEDFSRSLGGMIGGGQTPGPASGPAPAPAPPSPAATPDVSSVRPPVPSTSRVWGDAEAEAAGLYERPASVPSTAAPVAPPAPVLQQPRQSAAPTPTATVAGVPTRQMIPALLRAVSDPYLPQGQKQAATEMLKSALDEAKLPGDVKEYLFAVGQGETRNFTDWDVARKKAASTQVNVNTQEGFEQARTKAQIAVDTDMAKEVGKQAVMGQRLLPLITQVEALADKTPGGWAGPVAASLAKAFAAAGLEVTAGMSNAELLQSISQRLIPIVREPGPTSEKELAIYLKAVPGLMQSPDGRKKVARMTRVIIQRSVDVARVYRANIGASDLYEKLAALDKPIIPDDIRAEVERHAAGAAESGTTKAGVPFRILP